MFRTVPAAVAYFAVVFTAGFALGAVRVVWVAPRIGETLAVAVESPLMVAIAWIACGWAVARFAPPAAVGPRLAMGALALALLILAELALWVGLRRTAAGFLANYATPGGALGLAAQLLFAAFPLWRA